MDVATRHESVETRLEGRLRRVVHSASVPCGPETRAERDEALSQPL